LREEQFKISFKENTIISPRVIPLGFGVTIYIFHSNLFTKSSLKPVVYVNNILSEKCWTTGLFCIFPSPHSRQQSTI
jgi:hypothetical protein